MRQEMDQLTIKIQVHIAKYTTQISQFIKKM